MATFEEVQNTVHDRLKALADAQVFDIFEVGIPVGYELSEQFMQHTPYILVSYGGKNSVANYMQGITGTRDNLKWTSVAVEIVANSPRTVREIAGLIRDSLEGWQPDPDWGELVEQLSGDYSVRNPDYELWPVRYAQGIVFNTNANAQT